jgi:hypothetical protein
VIGGGPKTGVARDPFGCAVTELVTVAHRLHGNDGDVVRSAWEQVPFSVGGRRSVGPTTDSAGGVAARNRSGRPSVQTP